MLKSPFLFFFYLHQYKKVIDQYTNEYNSHTTSQNHLIYLSKSVSILIDREDQDKCKQIGSSFCVTLSLFFYADLL